MGKQGPTNAEIAGLLEEIASLLEAQGSNPHQVRAYRDGAESVRSADQPVAGLASAGDQEQLQRLSGIGPGLAGTIAEFVRSGRSGQLERLRGEVAPETVFAQVPGIGVELGRRLATELDISTLEELEQAAHDGRLARVEGFGPRRVAGVQATLAGMLSQAARQRKRQAAQEEVQPEQARERPSVATLLAVDAEYRRKAEAGELKKIAPRRFNPAGEAWLPVLHTERDGWSFTALYSNTARAHELGTTHDWVVLYYKRGRQESQATVITAARGPLQGKRLVRGREQETRQYYAESTTS